MPTCHKRGRGEYCKILPGKVCVWNMAFGVLVLVLYPPSLPSPLPPKLKFAAMQSGAALVFCNLFFIWRVCVESWRMLRRGVLFVEGE